MLSRIDHHYEYRLSEVDDLGGRRPIAREQVAKVVARGHARQASKYVAQVGEWVFTVALAGDDQRVKDGRALTGLGMSNKQEVFLSDAGGPDCVFDKIVIEPGLAVLQMGTERAIRTGSGFTFYLESSER